MSSAEGRDNSQTTHGEKVGEAQDILECIQQEYKRSKRSINLLNQKEGLERSMSKMVEELLVEEPKLGGADTSFEYATDLKYALPPNEFFLAPEFFKRPAQHFVLLKRFLELHWINPITKEQNEKLALLP